MANKKEQETEQEIEQPQQPETEPTTAVTSAANETVPGGKYIVGDRFVDAFGKDLGAAPKGK